MRESFIPSAFETMVMNRCINLAHRGGKFVERNPKVGAVIVHGHRIIGEGWHQKYGDLHAERNALKSVRKTDRKWLTESHMYVSLEPCNHHGKTPPCTDAILKYGIKKVTIGILDPTDSMSGRSVKMLRNAGIEVNVFPLQNKLEQLIQDFRMHQFEKRPYVLLKFATSKDGFIGKEDASIWFTNPITGIHVHQLRRNVDGILVGTNTAILDNPRLTTRKVDGPSPLRIVLDRTERIPKKHHLIEDDQPTLIITAKEDYSVSDTKRILQIPESQWNLKYIFSQIFEYGVNRLMIEGGAALLKAVIKNELWDECHYIKTSRTLSEGMKAPLVRGFVKDKVQISEDKLLIINRL